MSDVTQILWQIETGDPAAAERLLPLIYQELRRLAAAKLSHEKAGHSLQATALVHEAYLRLVDSDHAKNWDSRRHFFAAAAEAMRRILIEHARRNGRLKRGGDRERVELQDPESAEKTSSEELLDLEEALQKLAQAEPDKAEIVNLRYFAGLTVSEISEVLNISEVTVKRRWRYARAWLHKELN